MQIHALAWIFSSQKNVKQLIQHVAIYNNILFSFCRCLAYFFFAPCLPLPLISGRYTRNEQLYPENSPP